MTATFNFDDFDTSVRPQDDLFRHVNGAWLARTVIPDDKANTGAFTDLRDGAEAAVRDIITGLGDAAEQAEPGSVNQKIADLYASFMDTEAIEAAGTEPLRPPFEKIAGIDSVTSLVQYLGWLVAQGMPSVVGIGTDADPGDPANVMAMLGQAGIGLPDEAYYREPQHAEILAAYPEAIATLFELAGVEDPKGSAALVVDLETRIAALHWDAVTCRDMQAMYNPWPVSRLEQLEGLHWGEFAEGAGLERYTIDTIMVAQPSFVEGLPGLLTEDLLPAWRAWARWTWLRANAPFLTEAIVRAHFDFYGRRLSGTTAMRDRWKRAVGLVEASLGEAVGQVYVERHFRPEAKQRMDELVANLIEAYRESISELDWMGEDTRKEALAKLDGFRPHIGYPSRWRDYGALEIGPDLFANVLASSRFEADHELSKAGRPVDREEWFMTPQTVNAYYHPMRNEIVFPAAILQPPFFHADGDDAINYGGIGAVIGHEIGHGFDDQGSTCDAEGRLRNWWTDQDREAFTARTSALIEQYSALSPEGADGQHVNGELTIGENIGDLGGLSISHRAFKRAQAAQGADAGATIDGLTPDQRFFMNWGAVWQSKARPETVKRLLAIDPHSPNEFRCNQAVRNVPAFYQTFDVQPGDALWLDEDQRVKIW